jgi:hypothetical protein
MINVSTVPTSSTIYEDIAAGRAYPVGLTVDVYDRLIDQHWIAEDSTTELIDGVIVKKDRSAAGEDPISVGDRHRVAVIRLGRYDADFRLLGCYLQTQQPIVLPPDNEPEPDGSVIRGSEENSGAKPRAADVLAVIEVADNSLSRDLGPKLRAYAAAGIPQYIVADLQHNRVLVHTEPADGTYVRVVELRAGQLCIVNAERGTVVIPVDRLLP